MKTDTKAMRLARLYNSLAALGFTFEESNALRRIEMTLHRWSENECGNGNEYVSWGIERDETSGKPFMVVHPHTGKPYRRAIADKERGALKRLARIVAERNKRSNAHLLYYYQSDPRGCAIYLLTPEQYAGGPIDSVYNRGLAVCA